MRTTSHFAAATASPNVPPGPRGLPWVGSYFAVRDDPLELFSRGHDRYGDIVRYRFGPFRFVTLRDPEAINHVLVKNHRNYVKSRSYRGLRLVLGNGLVTSEGEFWRRQRKLSQPAFHHQRLAQLADTMARVTTELADEWDGSGDHSIDVHEQMVRLTLRIVGHTLFSTELREDAGDVGPAITVAMRRANKEAESVFPIPTWLPTPLNIRFARARRTLDATIQRIVDDRRAHGRDVGDVLSMLMAKTETGDAMTNQQLRDELMTLFLAGHETVATAMSWIWMVLTRYPDVADRVRAEVRNVLDGRLPSFADLAALEYTGRVIDECMRLFPPVWIFERQALAPDRLGDYDIERDTMVAVCTWSLHRNPRLWPDPLRFDPERFLPEAVRGRDKSAYLPFGAGPRICIGNSFALMEAKIIVATLISRHSIVVDSPFAVGFDPGVTLRPWPGMPGRVEPRRDRRPT